MRFPIVFFLLFSSFQVGWADALCDQLRKDPSSSIGYISNEKGFCSGILLSPHLALTAGHCVNGQNAANIKFSLSPSESRFVGTKNVILHPSYWKARDGSAGGLDLALLVLESTSYGNIPMLFLKPYSSEGLRTGEVLSSWGFGLQDGGEKAKRHRKTVVFGGREDSITSGGNKIQSARLTFHRGETGEIQCSGDSGGPVLYNLQGQWVIVAVNSRSAANISYASKQGLQRKLASKEYFCNHSDKFLSANLGLAKDWIDETLNKFESDKSTTRCEIK